MKDNVIEVMARGMSDPTPEKRLRNRLIDGRITDEGEDRRVYAEHIIPADPEGNWMIYILKAEKTIAALNAAGFVIGRGN